MRGEARKDPAKGKLPLNWEGPFRVTTTLQNGEYQLDELDDGVVLFLKVLNLISIINVICKRFGVNLVKILNLILFC